MAQPRYVRVTFVLASGRRSTRIMRDPEVVEFSVNGAFWLALSGALVDQEGVAMDRPTHAVISQDIITRQTVMVMDYDRGVLVPVPAPDQEREDAE